MRRPACVVRVEELPAEKRPRMLQAAGVASTVRAVGNLAGLRNMGLWQREIDPGNAGTHRHFHSVEEEWVFVLRGRGTVRIGPLQLPVRAGHFVAFPPGPRPHHFVAQGDEPLVVIEGGERRPAEERGWYVDLGKVWQGRTIDDATEPPPAEEGDAKQCIHLEDLPERVFDHPVDARAHRSYRSLHGATALERQAVRWSRVAAGDRTTAYHTHDRTDEWLWLLEGRARARVGDHSFEVSAGDFLAHPAGGQPHDMTAETELVYLMGGQIDPDDVVLYPEGGVRKLHGRIEPL